MVDGSADDAFRRDIVVGRNVGVRVVALQRTGRLSVLLVLFFTCRIFFIAIFYQNTYRI